MRWRDEARRVPARRRRLALLVGASSLLGLGAAGPARSQEVEPTGTAGEVLFGSYQIDARGVGAQVRYEVEGMLPGGAPVFDIGIPETLTRFGSGPIGYGLAGLAYPGPLLADLGVLIAQTGNGSEDSVPPWPIKAEAFYPTGPTEVDESQGPAVQKVTSGDLGVLAQGAYPPVNAPGLLDIGTITAATRSSIEGELAVSRTHVALGDVRILGGLIQIDSIVTDLVGAHDGTTGSTSGGTTASGVRFLGLAASLTEEGLVLAEAPPTEGPAAPLGGLLAPLAGPLAPLEGALAPVHEQVGPRLDELLAQLGIELAIVEPHVEQVESGAATRSTAGLQLTFRYAGKEQAAMQQLLDSIPPELKPALGPIPNPITFLGENHIGGLALAPGSVTALATPPFPAFELDALPVPDLGDGGAGLGDLGAPAFTTPVAPLPAAPAGADAGPGLGAAEPASTGFDGAVPAILVALALLAAPLFGLGSSRLADNVLAPAATPCPIGLDQPPPPPRPS